MLPSSWERVNSRPWGRVKVAYLILIRDRRSGRGVRQAPRTHHGAVAGKAGKKGRKSEEGGKREEMPRLLLLEIQPHRDKTTRLCRQTRVSDRGGAYSYSYSLLKLNQGLLGARVSFETSSHPSFILQLSRVCEFLFISSITVNLSPSS